MPVVMRETQRRRLLHKAYDENMPHMASKIHDSLQRRYSYVKRDLRRQNLRKRLEKAYREMSSETTPKYLVVEQVLFKADNESWDDWSTSLGVTIEDGLTLVVSATWDVETKFWETRDKRAAPVNRAKLFADYQARTGRKIVNIGKDTETDVLNAIHNWYNTDAGLPDLITNLGQYFSLARAEAIARTESTYITSEVARSMMQHFGVQYFNVDLGDEVGPWPCEICTGQADANPHSASDDMPPYHPLCRCGVVYVNEDGGEFLVGMDTAPSADDEATQAPRGFELDQFGDENAPVGLPQADIPDQPDVLPDEFGVGGVGPGALDLPTAAPNVIDHTGIPELPLQPVKGMDYKEMLADEHEKTLTTSMIDALENYKMDSAPINDYLRGKSEGDADIWKAATQIGAAVRRSSLSEDIVLYRGITDSAAKALGELSEGAAFIDKGFASTSVLIDNAENYTNLNGGYVLVISAKAGAPGLAMPNSIDLEGEILLPRNSTFTVTKIEGNHIYATYTPEQR